MRIVVAMSGGVDSSVAAALLAEQGHDVIGLSMQLYDQSGTQSFGSCCTLDDLHDARRVAAARGFPHYIVNFERQFTDTVISNFVAEYTSGRTPIPCAHCNSDLKFSTLLDRAHGLGSDYLATGHYARVEQATDGRFVLRRSVDRDKDQSYFLFSLTQDQLSRAVFPVGALTKPEVRSEAHRLGLTVADKADSQEICFVPNGDYATFVESRTSSVRPGAVVNQQGERLATHAGIHRFTVGQRKGLGIAAQVPLYVLRIDAGSGDVTVGPPIGTRPCVLHHVRRELDLARRTVFVAAGGRADSSSAPAGARARSRNRRHTGRVCTRSPSARRYPWTGRGILRRRRRHGRRLDRLNVACCISRLIN
jgi:tRNA-specific 2-thiouridylase